MNHDEEKAYWMIEHKVKEEYLKAQRIMLEIWSGIEKVRLCGVSEANALFNNLEELNDQFERLNDEADEFSSLIMWSPKAMKEKIKELSEEYDRDNDLVS